MKMQQTQIKNNYLNILWNSIYICVFFYFGDISKLLDFYQLCMLDGTVDVYL